MDSFLRFKGIGVGYFHKANAEVKLILYELDMLENFIQIGFMLSYRDAFRGISKFLKRSL